jgi:hypothetical protein
MFNSRSSFKMLPIGSQFAMTLGGAPRVKVSERWHETPDGTGAREARPTDIVVVLAVPEKEKPKAPPLGLKELKAQQNQFSQAAAPPTVPRIRKFLSQNPEIFSFIKTKRGEGYGWSEVITLTADQFRNFPVGVKPDAIRAPYSQILLRQQKV